MSADGQGTKCRRKIALNFGWLSMLHERYIRQTDDRHGRQHNERELRFTFANSHSRSLKSPYLAPPVAFNRPDGKLPYMISS